jgi:hypothetical protein
MCPILSLRLRHSQPITSGSNIGETVVYITDMNALQRETFLADALLAMDRL